MRLADQVIAAAGSRLDEAYYHGALTALAADVARAECFELTDEVREACHQVAESKPSSILSALPMMRLPYAKTWIEWVMSPQTEVWHSPFEKPEALPRAVRAGCLFEAPESLNNGMMNVVIDWLPGVPEGQREPWAMPYSVYFEWGADRDVRLMKAELDRISKSNFLGFSDGAISKSDMLDLNDGVINESHMRATWPRHAGNPEEWRAAQLLMDRALTVADIKRFASWWDHMKPSFEVQIAFMATIDCLWPIATAFIVMLNAKGALSTAKDDFAALNKKRQRLARKPLREFVVTHLSLSRVNANRAAAHGLDRAAARAHMVRGHFKVRQSGIFWWSPFLRGAGEPLHRARYAVHA